MMNKFVIVGTPKQETKQTKLSVLPVESKEVVSRLSSELSPPQIMQSRVLSTAVQRKRESKRKGNGSSKHGISLPQNLEISPTVSGVFRFKNTAAISAYTVTSAELAGALGGICSVANSQLRPWASSAKIKKLVCYPANNAGTVTITQFDVNWSSAWTAIKDSSKEAVNPSGSNSGGAIVVRPPRQSLAADWFPLSGTAFNLFTLSSDQGSVIDLHVTYTLSNNFIAPTIGISTGTLGLVYYLALDGTTNIYRPTNLPSTS